MRRILLCTIIPLLLAGCKALTGDQGNGELIGVNDRGRYLEPAPYGMVRIPAGTLQLGPNDEDPTYAQDAFTRTISINSFYMDETEITNNEYRQFVHWVRDSILRRKMAERGIPGFVLEGEAYEGMDDLERPLNWKTRINPKDPDQAEAIEELYYRPDERFFGKRQIDTRLLVYRYFWTDLKQAAQDKNRFDFNQSRYQGSVIDPVTGAQKNLERRTDLILWDEVPVYPDTLCWVRDFSHAYNEPLTRMYFWHPAYGHYPVVGITWQQANAFCIWRTELLNKHLSSNRRSAVHDYRLPTEFEWEYAARGGLALAKYPWGGPYTRNIEGCFLANFKPLRGSYADDGFAQTARVASFFPNDYGLYDMAGNVAEWTSSAYDESAYMYVNDMNPDYKYQALPGDEPRMKRKVIRGGSWKDIEIFLQVSKRTYEYQDSAKSYIGFRCVRDYLGNSI
jgi:formylglycine-generating enzyme required for sulfatase activity